MLALLVSILMLAVEDQLPHPLDFLLLFLSLLEVFRVLRHMVRRETSALLRFADVRSLAEARAWLRSLVVDGHVAQRHLVAV